MRVFLGFFWGRVPRLSQVVRGLQGAAQRLCGGSQGRLRSTRAAALQPWRATLFNPARLATSNQISPYSNRKCFTDSPESRSSRKDSIPIFKWLVA